MLEEIKTAPNVNTFKKLIKVWDDPLCKCNFCAYHHAEISSKYLLDMNWLPLGNVCLGYYHILRFQAIILFIVF